MFVLASLWAGLLLAPGLPLRDPVLLAPPLGALAGALAVALAVTSRRMGSTVLLAVGFLLAGILRGPAPDGAPGHPGQPSPAASGRIPVVLRVGLPFLVGQCEENVRAGVEEVLAGEAGLRGARVILRGLDHDERRGERRMTVAGTYAPPQPPRNPMGYDARDTYRRGGIAGNVQVVAVLDEVRAPADRALAFSRRAVGRLIARVPEAEARGILEATLLGARGGILPGVESTMIRAGTYHVLAISGLHVGVLVFMISILATVMRLGRTSRVAVSVALVFAYVLFTGVRPSALRAGTFFLVLSIARLLEYKVDYPNAVCFAGTVLLLAFPPLAWDLGFRLSFGAVFGMTLFLPGLTGRAAGRPGCVAKLLAMAERGLIATFSAQVLTMPLILWTFGRVSLIAGLSNLVLLPIMSLALTSGVEGALLAGLLPGLGFIFMRSASLLVVVALRLAEVLTAGFNPLVYAGRPDPLRVAAYYGIVLYAGLSGGRHGRKSKLALLAAALALLLVRVPGHGGCGSLEAVFLYVGNGDACVMRLPGRETVVIDTGPTTRDYDAAASVILPYLSLCGIGTIDKLIITHSHNDHYGGIPTLIDNFKVREILVGTRDGEGEYTACLEEAERKGVPVLTVCAGDAWETAGVEFEVLHPGRRGGPGIHPAGIAGGLDDPNAWSLVIKATYGGMSILLTGDLTPAAQDSLVRRGVDLGCDVLKVPHHGHPGETSPAFAEALGASLAVISCGAKYFAEPDSGTIVLLEAAGMKALSTRTDGAVLVETDGHALDFHAVLDAGRP
ncbi:MAG: DNA internalization-related competence protein ComEC/Rec2 [bacterium]|jgi:competence protein ComEC